MFTLLRRMFWLSVLGGVGYAAYTTWQRRREPVAAGPATWPPLDTEPAPVDVPTPEPVVAAVATPTSSTWTEPLDGTCPVDFPIKGNANSGIYHVPGGRFYDRTVPERCYASEDAAQADGYRRAKA